jgi:AcrR family transcriptional regulator
VFPAYNERPFWSQRVAALTLPIGTIPAVPDVPVSQATTSSPRAPQAERLSRALVIDAAMTIARRDGLDTLSMRRLAEELGVSTMAAYRHVAGKDTLVDDVLEAAVASIDLDVPEDASWEEQITLLVERSYAVFLSVPGLAEHLHGRALSRPGLVRWLEALNAPLANAGIPYEQRVGFTPALVWMLRGAARLDGEWSEVMQSLEQISAGGPEDAPNMRNQREEIGDHQAEDFLKHAVGMLTAGLSARVTA